MGKKINSEYLTNGLMGNRIKYLTLVIDFQEELKRKLIFQQLFHLTIGYHWLVKLITHLITEEVIQKTH